MSSVQVDWFDAHATAQTWTALDEVEMAERRIRTVGILVALDRQHMAVATSHDDDAEAVDSVTVIPLVNVVSVTALQPAKRLWRRFSR